MNKSDLKPRTKLQSIKIHQNIVGPQEALYEYADKDSGSVDFLVPPGLRGCCIWLAGMQLKPNLTGPGTWLLKNHILPQILIYKSAIRNPST